MTPFEKRQYKRVTKRRKHQRDMAKLMQKVGGYNSFKWRTIVDRIRVRLVRKLQLAQARKEARLSNG